MAVDWSFLLAACAGCLLVACQAKESGGEIAAKYRHNFEELKSLPTTTTVADLKMRGLVQLESVTDMGGGCDAKGQCYSSAEQIGIYFGTNSTPLTERDRLWFCPVPKGDRIPTDGQWTANQETVWMCGKLYG